MAKILIVDDENDIRSLIERYAKREGYETAAASNGAEAIELCRIDDFDIIIMDIMMPDTDGFTASRKIKAEKDIPILMLSARGTEYDKLFGFDVGIDDYVVKPFSPNELMARIKVIINRHKPQNAPPTNSNLLSFGTLSVDTLGRNVYVAGKKTELTAKEYDLLIYLAQNKGIVLTRERILNAVWGYDYPCESRTVDWQIKFLRNKLDECRDYIKTIRGVGYKFEV